MSQQGYSQQPLSRMSVWSIAFAVFVGNVLCVLLGVAIYFCFVFGIALLATGGRR